jgi:hypothetical protein
VQEHQQGMIDGKHQVLQDKTWAKLEKGCALLAQHAVKCSKIKEYARILHLLIFWMS